MCASFTNVCSSKEVKGPFKEWQNGSSWLIWQQGAQSDFAPEGQKY